MTPRGVLPRKRARRDASLVIIATEGDREEPAYFDRLREHDLLRPKQIIHVEPPQEHASDPQSVLFVAKGAREGYGATQPDDRVWCVVDVDHHTGGRHVAGFTQMLKEAAEAAIEVAVSNPCFQVWYLLHVAALEGLVLTDYQTVSAALGPRVTEPRLPGGVPRECIDRARIDQAIQRAAASHDPSQPWPQQPGTTLHRLVSSILAP